MHGERSSDHCIGGLSGPNPARTFPGSRVYRLVTPSSSGDREERTVVHHLAQVGSHVVDGGGGICAARHLANHGADVTVVITQPARLTPVTGQQLRTYRGTTGKSADLDNRGGLGDLGAGVVVDAVVG